ncbi:MAG: NADH-quinone oxidoreductase subunit M [Planctomycetales bacterium]|nr:NADH-quinone oxidoreductase subunit M [Planctomycetales bacterium]NIM09252.1 NADH-quinone oxidoreductase subunit M [Planctomycetales bacterium]NIN77838.1 NADH-quinone oxidoreductase subunit M [Planctomycetales bacterium]NIO35022.1 NADH-quinone oxidoreductase subunit M [Planctomycetales bacterium]NIO46812.1 NADH-quinone oxidoreductase subunit M [Planctomycetales bacterium]
MNPYVIPLSLLVFLPTLGAFVLLFFGRDNQQGIKYFALVVTIATFLLSAYMALPAPEGVNNAQFSLAADAVAEMQKVFRYDWIPSFNIQYYMGIDGISFPLLLLTSFISMLAMAASWPITKHVKAYCILFLLLETGMLGVFMALDFFLFYVFWEVMLLPMYFLIGVWGGPRREYAAIKFFLYTLVGSVLMLIGILMLYFNSDLRALTDEQLVEAHVVESVSAAAAWREGVPSLEEAPQTRQHTFNILALQQMGQHTRLFSEGVFTEGGKSVQWWAFVLLFIGFVIKVPSVPVHTWLPDAHVEAPTPISMILAGVLLKMGGYGIIRICYPICPEAGYALAWLVCLIGVVSMVYGAFAALAQTDFKRMVAYSSVSHMGYVVLGIGVWSAVASNLYATDYWKMGMNGAMFQMIAHGISSAGMFFMVGVIYDRVHHRDLNRFGGLFAKMPFYSGLAIVIFFAGLGLPGLCGFIGEVLVVLSVWNFSKALAVISAAVVVLTAAYILWAIQRVYLGSEYKGPHAEALTPITAREWSIAVPLCVFAILFGVFPRAVFTYMAPSVNQVVQDLTEWKERADESAQVDASSTAQRPGLPVWQVAAAPRDQPAPAAAAAVPPPPPTRGSPSARPGPE